VHPIAARGLDLLEEAGQNSAPHTGLRIA